MKAVSFNVLADAYMGYGDYSHVQPKLLEPGARSDAVARLLRKLDGDIIGLQEVEEGLADRLRESNEWQLFWTQKGGNKPDGCLILVKQDITVRDFESYEYSDGSGHIAQLVKIGNVALLNTHIKWAPADSVDHIGVRQAEELVDRVGVGPAVLFADCNDRPGGPVRQVFEDAGFVNLCDEIPTALVDQQPMALDLLAARGIKGVNRTRSYDLRQIPNIDCPSDHIPLEADLDL